LLVEPKSKEKGLEKAYQQAKDFFPCLKEGELPKYILFPPSEIFSYLIWMKVGKTIYIRSIPKNIGLFGFIATIQNNLNKLDTHKLIIFIGFWYKNHLKGRKDE